MQLVKKHGKEHVYLDSKGDFIDLREVISDLSDGTGKVSILVGNKRIFQRAVLKKLFLIMANSFLIDWLIWKISPLKGAWKSTRKRL